MDAKQSSVEPMQANRTSIEIDSDRTIAIARTFNGPARVVFDAWTQAEFVKRWWAPKALGVSIVACDADVRVGGTYRYVLRNSTGEEIAFSGKYIELTPPSRMVYTQIFEPMAAAGEVVITITLDERDGKTRLVAHEVYPSKEAREGAMASGMEHGMRETMDQLDALVTSLSGVR